MFLKRRFNTSFFVPRVSSIFFFSKGVHEIIFHQGDQGFPVFPPRGSSRSSFFQGGKVYHPFCKETKYLLFFLKGAQYILIFPRRYSISSFSPRRPGISCFSPSNPNIPSSFQGGKVDHPFPQQDQVSLVFAQKLQYIIIFPRG